MNRIPNFVLHSTYSTCRDTGDCSSDDGAGGDDGGGGGGGGGDGRL